MDFLTFAAATGLRADSPEAREAYDDFCGGQPVSFSEWWADCQGHYV